MRCTPSNIKIVDLEVFPSNYVIRRSSNYHLVIWTLSSHKRKPYPGIKTSRSVKDSFTSRQYHSLSLLAYLFVCCASHTARACGLGVRHWVSPSHRAGILEWQTLRLLFPACHLPLVLPRVRVDIEKAVLSAGAWAFRSICMFLCLSLNLNCIYLEIQCYSWETETGKRKRRLAKVEYLLGEACQESTHPLLCYLPGSSDLKVAWIQSGTAQPFSSLPPLLSSWLLPFPTPCFPSPASLSAGNGTQGVIKLSACFLPLNRTPQSCFPFLSFWKCTVSYRIPQAGILYSQNFTSLNSNSRFCFPEFLLSACEFACSRSHTCRIITYLLVSS